MLLLYQASVTGRRAVDEKCACDGQVSLSTRKKLDPASKQAAPKDARRATSAPSQLYV